jgi:hypothetical protein
MEHMQYLVVRSHNPGGKPFNHPLERPDDLDHEHMCGHALMASCPPASHIIHKPEEPYPHQMPDLKAPDLMKLLDLSSKLPLEGEITPVMAWMAVLKNSNGRTRFRAGQGRPRRKGALLRVSDEEG